MKRLLCVVALAAAPVAAFAADVNVSVGVNQPGLYGRLDIGGFPQPQVLYPQPVYLQQRPGYRPAPIYLHVPPGHAKHWSKHCARYDACGRPVYFVRDEWYRDVYVPRYQQVRAGRPDHDDRRDHRGDDRRDDRHDRGHDRGRGHGNGRDR